MIGDRDNPITVAQLGLDQRYRWCRCSACGEVKQCTPDMDFWSPCNADFDGNHLGDPQLLCDPCHDRWLVEKCGVTAVIDQRPQDRQHRERTQN